MLPPLRPEIPLIRTRKRKCLLCLTSAGKLCIPFRTHFSARRSQRKSRKKKGCDQTTTIVIEQPLPKVWLATRRKLIGVFGLLENLFSFPS